MSAHTNDPGGWSGLLRVEKQLWLATNGKFDGRRGCRKTALLPAPMGDPVTGVKLPLVGSIVGTTGDLTRRAQRSDTEGMEEGAHQVGVAISIARMKQCHAIWVGCCRWL